MEALEAAKMVARENREVAKELVAVVRTAIEAAPKPARLTWGQLWEKQQATWRKPGGK